MTTNEQIITIICAVIASSGFWSYITNRHGKKDARTKMLVGLAHDRIVQLGMEYIERGYITDDEYDNLFNYLYIPYSNLGGNGTAKRIVDEISKLPIRK